MEQALVVFSLATSTFTAIAEVRVKQPAVSSVTAETCTSASRSAPWLSTCRLDRPLPIGNRIPHFQPIPFPLWSPCVSRYVSQTGGARAAGVRGGVRAISSKGAVGTGALVLWFCVRDGPHARDDYGRL